MSSEENTTTTATEGTWPCFVRHEDAGGQCWQPAATKVYGLDFCEAHGEEARLGALLEEEQDAEWFFERFRASHVPNLSEVIRGGLSRAIDGLSYMDEGKYHRAIVRAHDGLVPDEVRERVQLWEGDEEAGYGTVLDYCLDSLFVLHKLLRIAQAEKRTWLVEVLEVERQSIAAEAAVALEKSVCATR
jgi:hypothetical protein